MSTIQYQYKTVPYQHQVVALERTAAEPFAGLLMEQRTGKSKVILDTAAMLHRDGRIDSLLITAPNGVHRNWVTDEIPIHLPDWVERYAVYWTGADTKKHLLELDKLFDRGTHLRILTINIEAFSTKKGIAFVKKFLQSTKCMWAIDESTRIKNPDAVTVKNIMKLRDLAEYRRILNGTPVTQGPLDVYSQLQFLSDEALPIQSYVAFKHRYAEFLPASHPMVQSIMRKTGTRWAPQIIATDDDGSPKYKNLEELRQWVDKFCYRVLRKDCVDMPEKLYKRWTIPLSAHQHSIIQHQLNNIKKGHTPEPINKLTAVMLYQRLLCGRIPKQLTGTGEHELMFSNPEDNPRIKAILEVIEAYPDASIIFWARFRTDLQEISDVIEKNTGKPVARYWGEISDNDREEAKQGFQAGRYQYFVGQQAAGGVGLPLHAADIMVYHSNTFSLYHRLQSEDRAENLAKKIGTLIIDFETPNSVDTKIITAYREKKDVANMITGDPEGAWLE